MKRHEPPNEFYAKHEGAIVKSDRIRIIVADNRASNRRGLRALLAFEPRIEVVGEANDGQEAVQLAADTIPDLVLMDVHMPVMDGIQATKKIKSSWPEVKVVLYSIHPDYDHEADQSGADYFLIKGSSDITPAEVILSFFPKPQAFDPAAPDAA
jgi:DNA-binding NarL/FixJ family response regulator